MDMFMSDRGTGCCLEVWRACFLHAPSNPSRQHCSAALPLIPCWTSTRPPPLPTCSLPSSPVPQLLTKSVTAGVLNGLGDVLAQVTVDKHRDFDFKRLAIFAFLGVAMIGPMLHAWYGVLGRVVTSTGPKGECGGGCVVGWGGRDLVELCKFQGLRRAFHGMLLVGLGRLCSC